MKKTDLFFVIVTLMAVMTGCGNKVMEVTEQTQVEQSQAGQTKEEQTDELANPWEFDVTKQDVMDVTGTELILPEGAFDVDYSVMRSGNLGVMNFSLEGTRFEVRVKPAAGFEDISGLYYEWDDERDDEIGGVKARVRLHYAEDTNNVLWYDGVRMYSLYTEIPGRDGVEAVRVARLVYGVPETSGEADIDNDETGKDDEAVIIGDNDELENLLGGIDIEEYTKMIMEQAKEGEKKFPVKLDKKESSKDVNPVEGGLFITADEIECRSMKLSRPGDVFSFGVELYNNTDSDRTFDQTKFVIEKENGEFLNPFVFEQVRDPETVRADLKRLWVAYTIYDPKGLKEGDKVSVYYDGVFITTLTAEK